jgi:5-methyltetrahydrofolate--homocysteine methyltransferase
MPRISRDGGLYMLDLAEIRNAVIKGARNDVKGLVEKAVVEGGDVSEILKEGLITAIDIVGDKFEKGEYFLPEMLMSAMAMKEGMKVLRPLLAENDVRTSGVVVLGTVSGDIHDIGKSIIGAMLEAAGFSVIDLGADVDLDKFAQAAKQNDADLIGLSALLTTTMVGMKDVVESVKGAGLKVKVMVGGAPVNQEFADQIGADGYAPDAPSAARKARELVSG